MNSISSPGYRELMRAKLGLVRTEEGDDALINDLLVAMAQARADYTLTFRGLASPGQDWLALFGEARDAASAWRARYQTRMAGEGDQSVTMYRVNPRYVLRNWVAEVAIRAVEDSNDAGPLDRILRLVQSPYDEHPGEEVFARPPALEYQGLSVSCSS